MRWDRYDTAMFVTLLVGLALVLCVLFASGCGTLPLWPVDKPPVPSQAVISPCDICDAPGVLCTPCCTACAIEMCDETCRRHRPDCEMCEENAYWDCYYQMCTHRQ